MTTSEQKQLAEKCAKFIGQLGAKSVVRLFEDPREASYFMHLAKKEMEKREWLLDSINLRGLDTINLDGNIVEKGKYKYHYEFFKGTTEPGINYHENEFIAFWKAVEQTGEMG